MNKKDAVREDGRAGAPAEAQAPACPDIAEEALDTFYPASFCGVVIKIHNASIHPSQSYGEQVGAAIDIDAIVGDLVRETNIFPNQVERAKEIIRQHLKKGCA